MNKELDSLLKKKEIETKKLEIADKQNNLFLCMAIGDNLNQLDKRIREIATEEQLEELHEKGLI
ncbi:MAG: hypothetical protein UHK60_11090 [Acutalibacteraceae bacterium]|nr:hypothetical protein [Acutalibacteraceae bacterium]